MYVDVSQRKPRSIWSVCMSRPSSRALTAMPRRSWVSVSVVEEEVLVVVAWSWRTFWRMCTSAFVTSTWATRTPWRWIGMSRSAYWR